MTALRRHVGTPAKLTPFRDRAVSSRGVACPSCGAEVGEPCHSSTGNAATRPHPARRRMAVRAEHRTAEQAAGSLYARSRTPKERRRTRIRAGLNLRELADLLGTSQQMVSNWEIGRVTPGSALGDRYGLWLREHDTT